MMKKVIMNKNNVQNFKQNEQLILEVLYVIVSNHSYSKTSFCVWKPIFVLKNQFLYLKTDFLMKTNFRTRKSVFVLKN